MRTDRLLFVLQRINYRGGQLDHCSSSISVPRLRFSRRHLFFGRHLPAYLCRVNSAGAFSDTLTSTNSATREISSSGSSSALVSPASLENKTGQKTGELSTSSKGQSIAHLEQSSLTHFALIEQEASLAESWVRLLSSVRSLRLFFFADDGTSCINRFTES